MEVLDLYVHGAMSHGLVAGSCAHTGYSVEGKNINTSVHVDGVKYNINATQFHKAGLMNLCSGGGPASQGGCNQMGIILLIWDLKLLYDQYP